MQSSIHSPRITNKKKYISFTSFCKKYGIIHYTTKGKNKHIEKHWKYIYHEMLTNNISLNTFEEIITYLQQTMNLQQLSKKFNYEYIIKELTNYSRLSIEFASNYKDYIRRLKKYAQIRKCTNMKELKKELMNYLNRYVVEVDYANKDNINDYAKQDWLIISRYICDFLEENNEKNDDIIELF